MIDLLYYTIELESIESGFESESKNGHDPGSVRGHHWDYENHFPEFVVT